MSCKMEDPQPAVISESQKEELKRKAASQLAKATGAAEPGGNGDSAKERGWKAGSGVVGESKSDAMIESEASEPEVRGKLLDSGFHDSNGGTVNGNVSSAETSSGSGQDSSGVSTGDSPRKNSIKYKYTRDELLRLREHPLSLRDPEFIHKANSEADQLPVLRRNYPFMNPATGFPTLPLNHLPFVPNGLQHTGGGGGGKPNTSLNLGFPTRPPTSSPFPSFFGPPPPPVPLMGLNSVLPPPPPLLPNDDLLMPSASHPVLLPPLPLPPPNGGRQQPPPPAPPFRHFRGMSDPSLFPLIPAPPPPSVPTSSLMLQIGLGDGLLPTPGHALTQPWDLGRRITPGRFGSAGERGGLGGSSSSVPGSRGGSADRDLHSGADVDFRRGGLASGFNRGKEDRFSNLSRGLGSRERDLAPPRRSAGGSSGPTSLQSLQGGGNQGRSYGGGGGNRHVEQGNREFGEYRGGGMGDGYHHHHHHRRGSSREEDDEPEWFSGGPTTQDDFIELHGLDEIEEKREPGKEEAEKKEEEPQKEKTPPPEEPNGQTEEEGVVEEEKPFKSVLNPAAPAFDINEILEMDSLPSTDLLTQNKLQGSGSRFSKFFKYDETPAVNEGAPDTQPPAASNKAPLDELFAKAEIRDGAPANAQPPRQPEQPAAEGKDMPGKELLDFVNRAQKEDMTDQTRREILARLHLKSDVVFSYQSQSIIQGILSGSFGQKHMVEQLQKSKTLSQSQREIINSILMIMNSNIPLRHFYVPLPPQPLHPHLADIENHMAAGATPQVLAHQQQQQRLRAAAAAASQQAYRSTSPTGLGVRGGGAAGYSVRDAAFQQQAAAMFIKEQQDRLKIEEAARRHQQQQQILDRGSPTPAVPRDQHKIFGGSLSFTPTSVLRKSAADKEKDMRGMGGASALPASRSHPQMMGMSHHRGATAAGAMGMATGYSFHDEMSERATLNLLFENVQRMQGEAHLPPLPRNLGLSVDEVERQQAAAKAAAALGRL